MTDRLERVGLGGGCHWCTEAVFQAVSGVRDVEQGFVRSLPPHEAWSEAVSVTYDPAVIDLATLIEIHLRTHASSSSHKMRGKYRSAIYVLDDGQGDEARHLLADLQAQFDGRLVTHVLSFEGFKHSDERFKDYYRTDPERPFCRRYIDPKLDRLRAAFAHHVSGQSPGSGR